MLPPGYACGQVVDIVASPQRFPDLLTAVDKPAAPQSCFAHTDRVLGIIKAKAAKRKESSDREKSASKRQRSSGDEGLKES